MGKTIDEQVLKGRTLAEGLRANVEELKERGVSAADIEKLENIFLATEKLGAEQDEIKEQYHKKTTDVSASMLDLKNCISEIKSKIKPFYTQDQWAKFGIMDKK